MGQLGTLQASSFNTLMGVRLHPICSYLLILTQNRLEEVALEVAEGDSLTLSDRKLAVDCSFGTCLNFYYYY